MSILKYEIILLGLACFWFETTIQAKTAAEKELDFKKFEKCREKILPVQFYSGNKHNEEDILRQSVRSYLLGSSQFQAGFCIGYVSGRRNTFEETLRDIITNCQNLESHIFISQAHFDKEKIELSEEQIKRSHELLGLKSFSSKSALKRLGHRITNRIERVRAITINEEAKIQDITMFMNFIEEVCFAGNFSMQSHHLYGILNNNVEIFANFFLNRESLINSGQLEGPNLFKELMYDVFGSGQRGWLDVSTEMEIQE